MTLTEKLTLLLNQWDGEYGIQSNIEWVLIECQEENGFDLEEKSYFVLLTDESTILRIKEQK